MPTIFFTDPAGVRREVQAPAGQSVADTATGSGVPGIVAECGGSLSCASCHVYVDEAWSSAVGPPGDLEDEMLDETISPRLPTSRLSCQVTVTDELDGMGVRIPEAQQ